MISKTGEGAGSNRFRGSMRNIYKYLYLGIRIFISYGKKVIKYFYNYIFSQTDNFLESTP